MSKGRFGKVETNERSTSTGEAAGNSESSRIKLPNPDGSVTITREVVAPPDEGVSYPFTTFEEYVLDKIANHFDLPGERPDSLRLMPVKNKAEKAKKNDSVSPASQTDFAVSCHALAKLVSSSEELEQASRLDKNEEKQFWQVKSQQVAEQVVALFQNDSYLVGAEAKSGYLNIEIDKQSFSKEVLRGIFEMGKQYGSENIGQGRLIVIDMSSPNIAKPFGVGHLRSTIIGEYISRQLEFMGYRVVRDNHIGDWGTQFGFILHAIEQWGNLDEIAADPITELFHLYVRANAAADATNEQYAHLPQEEAKEAAEKVKEAARQWFSRLEKGDPQVREQWQRVVDWSLSDFERVYDELGIEFDVVMGESYYESMLPSVIQMFRENGVGESKGGALVVDMRELEEHANIAKHEMTISIDRQNERVVRHFTAEEFDQIQLDSDSLVTQPDGNGGERTYVSTQTAIRLGLLTNSSSGEGLDDDLHELVETAEGGIDLTIPMGVAMKLGMVVDKGLGKVLVAKKDGTSLYHTRDIAGVIERTNRMKADGMIYVVGDAQTLYFQQLFEMMRRAGYQDIMANTKHIAFGLVTLPEGKMSTRKGNIVRLEDAMAEANSRARALMSDAEHTKLETEEEREEVARQLAMGALRWADLKSSPMRDIVFKWEEVISTKGDTAPYVQYAHARAQALLEKAGDFPADFEQINPQHPLELALVMGLAEFPRVVHKAGEELSSATITKYLLDLTQTYSRFYDGLTILQAREGLEAPTDEQKQTRLALTEAFAQVVKNGLYLLGIEAPDRV